MMGGHCRFTFDVTCVRPEAHQRMCKGKTTGQYGYCDVSSASEVGSGALVLLGLATLLRLISHESVEGFIAGLLLEKLLHPLRGSLVVTNVDSSCSVRALTLGSTAAVLLDFQQTFAGPSDTKRTIAIRDFEGIVPTDGIDRSDVSCFC